MAARKTTARREPAAAAMAALGTRLRAAFSRAVETLERSGLSYAVVGGLAVGVHGEPRVTRDLDFVIAVESDAEAERVVRVLQGAGYLVESLFEDETKRISTVRTIHRKAPGVFTDFLFHTTRVEEEIVSDSTREHIAGVRSVRVAARSHLLAMKVLASRPKDLVDLQHLAESASASDKKAVERLLRLMESRGAAPGRQLTREWRAFLARLETPPAGRPARKRLRRLTRRR